MIIFRYLTKEVMGALLGVTFVLLLIFLSNQLVRYLSYAASGKVAASVVLQLMGIEIPYLLALLLPLGLYLGILLVYSRLYADNELRVLHASGLSVNNLLCMTGLFASFITIVVAILMLWANPLIAQKKEKLLASGNNIFNTIMPGRFQVSSDGNRVVYVEKISRDRKQADNVFIAQQGKPDPDSDANDWTVLSAEHGYQIKEPTTQERFVLTTNGYRYEGIPGQNNFKIIQFGKYAIRASAAMSNSPREADEAIPSLQLLKNYSKPELAAEFQWRLAIPLSAIILALLAVPLSQVAPRKSRYAMLFPAILLYVVYVNLLFVARNFIELEKVSAFIGMWWVHIGMLILVWGVVKIQARRQAL